MCSAVPGIYSDCVMFAIVDRDKLYLKSDDSSSRALAEEGVKTCIF